MLQSFREKLSTPTTSSTLSSSQDRTETLRSFSANTVDFLTTLCIEISTTPPGSPPPNALASLHGGSAPAPAPANGSSILEALANIARQNTASNTSNVPAPAASYNMPASSLPQPVSSTIAQPAQSYPPPPQPVNAPSSLPFSLGQMLGQHAPQVQNNSVPPQFPGAPAPGAGNLDNSTQQQIMLIKALADQGVPFDKIPALIQSMTGGALPGAQPPAAPAAAQSSYPPAQQSWNVPGSNSVRAERDRGYGDSMRSPPHKYGGRSRSRSPERGWGQRGSPRNGRDYGRNSPPRGRHDERDRGGRRSNDYRQRSPPGRRNRSPSPINGNGNDFPHVDRWVEFDRSLPPGTIRVLSRTLFVGGVT